MPRILVVDDSTLDRLLARRLLEKDAELILTEAIDGTDALRQMELFVPDAVVTDLQMQPMDGLQLVETVRRKYPFVPVVLMTAHGSEEVAAQALQAGAANYVPKSELPRHLLPTIRDVLAATSGHRRRHELMNCLERRQIELALANDSALIPPLVDLIQQWIAKLGGVDEPGRLQVAMALEEALLNAMYHGNLEWSADELADSSSQLVSAGRDLISERRQTAPYNRRRVQFIARIDRQHARFIIRDEGRGFDRQRWDEASSPAALTSGVGRGLVLIKLFMDEVALNERGNEITMVKRWSGNAAVSASSCPAAVPASLD